MSAATIVKTGFSAGELDPRLLGRSELEAQTRGAATLTNVLVQVTGGVSRRPGLRFSVDVPAGVRLEPFETADAQFVLVFGPFKVDIVADDAIVATPNTPAAANWTAAQVPQLAFARLGNSLLICHPELEPRQLVRLSTGAWQLQAWSYAIPGNAGTPYPYRNPFARFAAEETAIQPVHATLAANQAIPAGQTVVLKTTDPFFTAGHLGVRLRIKGRQVRIDNVQSATQAIGLALNELNDGQTTRDWDEQAFSFARGWPVTVGFWQDRLVIGGSRDLPDAIWMSRTGRYFDFDEGTGLDDEAIRFRLGTERTHAIRALVSGRQLQVFTSVGEWALSGDPLTPSTVRADQQTGIGSLTARQVQPVDVDGATLFLSRNGSELREFLFTSDQQAYQAADLAVLARHLIVEPIDLAFDPVRRLVLAVRRDGNVAAATLDRENGVVAFSLLRTVGNVKSVAHLDGRTWFLVDRDGVVSLEWLSDAVQADGAVVRTSGSALSVWSGLARFNGRQVWLTSGDTVFGKVTVSGGTVSLPAAVTELTVGLPFAHTIEPSRVLPGTSRPQDGRFRPVRLTFRLLATTVLRLDLGKGAVQQPLPVAAGGFTGDHAVRLLGWRRGIEAPVWRIVQDDPVPFTLLSISYQLQVID